MKLTQHIDRVREGLTEHTVQSKTSHSKVERNPTHIHHWLWKLKMHVRVLLWLELMYQGGKFRSDTHTHTHTLPKHTFLIQCLWLTELPERKTPQHVALCQPVQIVIHHKAVFCSFYTDPSFSHRMHVLHWSRFLTISASSKLMWKWYKMSL